MHAALVAMDAWANAHVGLLAWWTILSIIAAPIVGTLLKNRGAQYPTPEQRKECERQAVLVAWADELLARHSNLVSFVPVEYEEPDGIGAPTELPRAS